MVHSTPERLTIGLEGAIALAFACLEKFHLDLQGHYQVLHRFVLHP